ncbi:MAG: hypothetical protein OTJ98_07605 [Dehalococcoidia bacterium]|nr:hypothetical protein [Dehalococcoidia bacterium]
MTRRCTTLVLLAERPNIAAKAAGVTDESGATSVNDVGASSIMIYDSERLKVRYRIS